MFLDYKQVNHLFIVCGKTDLRKGIDGLASIVQHEYQLYVYDNALFLFCGGRQDRFKMLYYDKDGFLLLYKRLDQGKLRWPRTMRLLRLNRPTFGMSCYRTFTPEGFIMMSYCLLPMA